jgi:hypothetical protein
MATQQAIPQVGGNAAPLVKGNLLQRAQAHYQYLTSIGATPNEATMLTSAAMAESGFNPKAVHDSGNGYGMYGHNLNRLDMRGMSAQEQTAAALNELRNRPEGKLVNSTNDPTQLTNAQMRFERPRGWTPEAPWKGLHYEDRLAYTKQFSSFGQQGNASVASDVNTPAAVPSENAVNAGPATLATVPTSDQTSGLGAGAVPTDQTSGLGGSLSDMWNDPSKRNIALAIMSGIGKMASSNSRFFGGALLQGIGGGAEAYQKGLVDNANIMKNTLGLAADRYKTSYDNNGNMKIFDNVLKQYVTPEQRMAGINAMSSATGGGNIFNSMGQPPQPNLKDTISQPVVAGVGANAAPAVANAPVAPDKIDNPGQAIKTDGSIKDESSIMNETLMNKNNWVGYDETQNPLILQEKRAEALRKMDDANRLASVNATAGGDPEIAKTQDALANQYKAQAQTYQDQINKTLKEKAAPQIAEANAATQRRQDYVKDATTFNQNYESNRAGLIKAANALHEIDSGPGAKSLADMTELMQRYQLPVTDANKTLLVGSKAQQKQAVLSAFNLDIESGAMHAPATAIKSALQAAAEPGLPPEDSYNIIAQTIAKMDYMHDRNNAVVNGRNIDVNAATKDFEKKNPYEDYSEKAYSEVPVPKGSSNQNLYKLTGHIADPDTGKAVKVPPAAPLPDPKERKVGKIYTNPNGVPAKWTGSGWKAIY